MSNTPRIDRLEKNYIINGNMDFWQRGDTFTTTSGYLADRWNISTSNTATRTVTRSGTVPDISSKYSLQHVVGSADASVGASDFEMFRYRMEGNDFRNLYGKQFTISFKVRSTITGLMPVALRNAANNRSYVTLVNIDQANTWLTKTITITHDTTGSWNLDELEGLQVLFVLMSGTDFHTPGLNSWQAGNYFGHSSSWNFMGTASAQINISQVMIVLGDFAPDNYTGYSKSYLDELSACERYFEKSFQLADAPGIAGGTISNTCVNFLAGFSNDRFAYMYKTRKRVIPTSVIYNINSGAAGTVRDVTGSVDVTAAVARNSESGLSISISGGTVGNQMAGNITADAEY